MRQRLASSDYHLTTKLRGEEVAGSTSSARTRRRTGCRVGSPRGEAYFDGSGASMSVHVTFGLTPV
jgi:hypothetical protein